MVAARRQNGAIRIVMQRKPAAPQKKLPPHPVGCRSAGARRDTLPGYGPPWNERRWKRWRTIISVAANRPASSGKNTQSDICKLPRQSASIARTIFWRPPPPLACDGQHDNFPALASPRRRRSAAGPISAQPVVRQSDPGVPPWSATAAAVCKQWYAVIAIDLQATFAQQNPVGKIIVGMVSGGQGSHRPPLFGLQLVAWLRTKP